METIVVQSASIIAKKQQMSSPPPHPSQTSVHSRKNGPEAFFPSHRDVAKSQHAFATE
jgi:hypothetical protein